MGLITKEVQVRVNTQNADKLKRLGYDIPMREASPITKARYNKDYVYDMGNYITIKTEDLSSGSNVKVICSCDYCGVEYPVKYKKYLEVMNSDIPKMACNYCVPLKVKESNLLNYNVESTSELESVKAKTRATNRGRRGVDYPSQSAEVREKVRLSVQEHYGVDNVSQSDEIKEKKIETMNKHYGVDYYCQSDEGKEAIRNTNLQRYGVSTVLALPEYREVFRQNNLKKYGTEHPMQNKEVQQRAAQTYNERYKDNNPRYSNEANRKRAETFYKNQTVSTSNQQRYLADLYGMILNYPLKYWNVDMYDIKDKTYLEYDGSGHFLSVQFNGISQEEFQQKERARFYSLKRDGYKMIRIISRKDYLPCDNALLQMMDDAKQYFSDYPMHSWISFDIDEGIVKNAEYERSYFYGKLRKIKKSDLKTA